jgi:MerR family transcriptional regulator, mercuric resistance operon regulatory protein
VQRVAEERLSIGALSERTGCSVETIRYYERIGLLPAPPRTEGGQRTYTGEHVRRLAFAVRVRGLDFPLTGVRELLRLSEGTAPDPSAVREMTNAHLQQVRAKIAELQRIAYQLEALLELQSDRGSAVDPIIESLRASSGATPMEPE